MTTELPIVTTRHTSGHRRIPKQQRKHCYTIMNLISANEPKQNQNAWLLKLSDTQISSIVYSMKNNH